MQAAAQLTSESNIVHRLELPKVRKASMQGYNAVAHTDIKEETQSAISFPTADADES